MQIQQEKYPISHSSCRALCATDSCSGTTDILEEYADAGSTGLGYEVAMHQFILNSKTDSAWAGTCKTFTLVLSDGAKYHANFKFKK